ncbi:beta-lactamase/transpeptidase-like protein [Coniella lustricola]|uniref:Beta-lactamase/transpeptidase-like protein n=1 Tax=Coniella lustricola TaxID=2025994 RepID=A0A2T3A899_9PEZI|nr:beta-lactamase/transpeptidase-like protein [Coniella lustricola]
MASSFEQLLVERTKKNDPAVHGVLIKCVGRNGEILYAKTAGYKSLADDAAPLTPDATLKMGSATKLITSIALLQCVDDGLLTLDEPISRILPELANNEIIIAEEQQHQPQKQHIEAPPNKGFATKQSTKPITARHLLTHTSGLAYWFLHPLLIKWKQSGAAGPNGTSQRIVERFKIPLLFEPGEGCFYGPNLDWAGIVVSRLHSGVSLEEYMIERIWKAVDRTAPFPTFHVSRHHEYEARLMQSADRAADTGNLTHSPGNAFCVGLEEDDEGGAGLTVTMDDYVAVLQDLICNDNNATATRSKLFRNKPRESLSLLFGPQFRHGSYAAKGLVQQRSAWDMVAGPVVTEDEDINHTLGGLLITGEVPEIGQPAETLCWGGSPNIVWFANRERGVAGFFATQMSPFGNPAVKELVNAWKKDFWGQYDGAGGRVGA